MRQREKSPFRDKAAAYREKSAFKIVSDPFAPEEEWVEAALSLPAAAPASKSTRTSVLAKARKVSTFKTCLALSVMTISSVLMVRSGYDWAYHLIDLGISQARGMEQGVMAHFSLVHAVYPITLGILFGGRVRSTHSLNLKWILFLSISGAAIVDSLVYTEPVARVAQVALAAVVGSVAYVVTRWNRTRLRVSNLALPELWNVPVLSTLFCSAMLCTFASSTERLRYVPLELASYFVGIAAISWLCKPYARTKWAHVEATFLVLSPIFVCNVLNIALNLISLALDPFKLGAQLSWHAVLSAILINLVAFAALFFGWSCRFATPFQRLISRRS